MKTHGVKEIIHLPSEQTILTDDGYNFGMGYKMVKDLKKWNIRLEYSWDDYEDKEFIYTEGDNLYIPKVMTIRSSGFIIFDNSDEAGNTLYDDGEEIFECRHDTIVGLDIKVNTSPI